MPTVSATNRVRIRVCWRANLKTLVRFLEMRFALFVATGGGGHVRFGVFCILFGGVCVSLRGVVSCKFVEQCLHVVLHLLVLRTVGIDGVFAHHLLDATCGILVSRSPGCGFQRALHAALHGHWAEAINYNLFLIYSLPYLLCLALTEWVMWGKWQMQCRRIFESQKAGMLYLVLFITWGIVRNILGI